MSDSSHSVLGDLLIVTLLCAGIFLLYSAFDHSRGQKRDATFFLKISRLFFLTSVVLVLIKLATAP